MGQNDLFYDVLNLEKFYGTYNKGDTNDID